MTFLSPFSFPGYYIIVKNRSSINHGDIGFLIKINISFKIRDDLVIWAESEIESFFY